MNVQVLIAAMHQTDHSILEKMNIQSDAIVGNQCDTNSIEDFIHNGHSIRFLNFAERGVGLNRNNALMRATGDICLFADDDMRFFDNYVNTVEKAFNDNPKADVIIFNIKENVVIRYINKKARRVNKFNFLRYGAARIAVRLSSVKERGIYFNECFGGGTEHSAGEDNLFLASCLKAGLRVYTSPCYLAELLDDRESSWFRGYNEKYLRDKGCLYKTISPKWWILLCFQDAVRHKKMYGLSAGKSFYKMIHFEK